MIRITLFENIRHSHCVSVSVCMFAELRKEQLHFHSPLNQPTLSHTHSNTCTKHLTKLLAQHIHIREQNTQNNINQAISNENRVS